MKRITLHGLKAKGTPKARGRIVAEELQSRIGLPSAGVASEFAQAETEEELVAAEATLRKWAERENEGKIPPAIWIEGLG